jgi:hypothetical protein
MLALAAHHVFLPLRSLVVRGRVLASGEELEGALARAAPVPGDEAVVHLVVRRTAKVGWSAAGSDSFELSILASDSADNVQRWLSRCCWSTHSGLHAPASMSFGC